MTRLRVPIPAALLGFAALLVTAPAGAIDVPFMEWVDGSATDCPKLK